MYKNRKTIYAILFLLFFLLEALHLFPHFIPVGSPIEWLKPLGHYAPIALALLLLFIIRIGEIQKEKLEESLHEGGDLITRIEAESKRVTELRERTDELVGTTQRLAEQIRSSDALLHGKLFFFQQDYKAASEIFEELYAGNAGDVEVNRWLGICLLRDRQAKRAIPLLEYAAKARHGDPELWLATGEAKFRSWDRALFSSAEEDIQKALQLGIRNKEQAQLVLAKIQLTRDRNVAKATLRDALSRNPGSPQIVSELGRVLLDEHDLAGVIEITDRGLATSRRNWAMYPLRAEAYIRRGELGDLDRAHADIEEAKRGNTRDFNVYRVDTELSLARARSTESPADSRIIIAEARDKLGKIKELFRHSLKSQVLALRARLSLMLGDSDDCVLSAQESVKNSEFPTPNSHLLLCAALTQKRNWVQLSRASQHMREVFPIPAISAWSSLYILLAEIFSRQSISGMQETLRQCDADLTLYPGFDPTVRSEWIEHSWEFPLVDLGPSERKLGLALIEFLTGRRRYDAFLSELKSLALITPQ